MNKNRQYFAWRYPAQKFGEAVSVLTRSFAPNWQRMEWALTCIHGMIPAHFPDKDLYSRSRKLLDEASAYGPLEINGRVWRGSFENTLRRRKRVTFERYATEIVEIYDEIRRRRGPYFD